MVTGDRVPASLGIPADAHRAWLALADVVRRRGPVACEADPDRWWPSLHGRPDEGAVRCCASCPARLPCLAYALAAGERNGLWGGLTGDQRIAVGREQVA
jgi:hypothetical protein